MIRKYKHGLGSSLFDLSNILMMIAIMLFTIYPLYYIVLASISDPMKIANFKGILLTAKGFNLQAYQYVFENPNILNGYKNTLIYVIAGTFINLTMTSIGAYVLSRKSFSLRNYLMFIIVFTMYFQGGLIPTYMVIRNLNMIDTLWAMIIPGAITTWNLIVMRTSFLSIPDELEESARMDGANDVLILFRIIVPLSMPVIAVMALFYGVAHWNSWFNAVIYLRSRDLFPLQLFLREILVMDVDSSRPLNMSDLEGIKARMIVKYAAIVVSTVPILFVYPFLQRYFIKGVMVGALKG